VKKIYIYILSLFIISSVFAGAKLNSITAKSENGDIKIEWYTSEETNVKNFVVERQTSQGTWVEIQTVNPTGNNSYYYCLDNSAYKGEDMVFIYRLRIVDNDGKNTYSGTVAVSHSVSGVKRTWGSIKAMFR
jgi:hypothetical protein